MAEQFFVDNRDDTFTVWFQTANGSPIDITGRAYRFRLYPNSGSGEGPVINIGPGAGACEIISGSGGQLKVNTGTLSVAAPSYGTGELTRSGTDIVATWPASIVFEGTQLMGETAGIYLGEGFGVRVMLQGNDIIIRNL